MNIEKLINNHVEELIMENRYFSQFMDDLHIQQPLTTERLLRCLGASGRLIGFRYAVFMLDRVVEDPDNVLLITKNLYPDTAKQFGVSAASVERGLRTLIRVCWSHADHSLLDYIAGVRLRRTPTNSEFLDMLAGYLRAK